MMGPGLPKLQVGTAGWRWLGLYLASIGGALGRGPVGEPKAPSRVQETRKATNAVLARRRQVVGAQAATYFIRIRSAVAVAVIEG